MDDAIHGKSLSFERVCMFSSLLLWTSMTCAYCVAIVLVCLHMLLIFVTGSFTLVSKLFYGQNM